MSLFRYADLIGGVVKVISELENAENDIDEATRDRITKVNNLLDSLTCDGSYNKMQLDKCRFRWFASDVLTKLRTSRSCLTGYAGLKYIKRVLIRINNYKVFQFFVNKYKATSNYNPVFSIINPNSSNRLIYNVGHAMVIYSKSSISRDDGNVIFDYEHNDFHAAVAKFDALMNGTKTLSEFEISLNMYDTYFKLWAFPNIGVMLAAMTVFQNKYSDEEYIMRLLAASIGFYYNTVSKKYKYEHYHNYHTQIRPLKYSHEDTQLFEFMLKFMPVD